MSKRIIEDNGGVVAGKIRLLVVTVGMLAVLAGCGVHKPFELMDSSVQMRPGTIAVISCENSEATLVLAESLTQQLKSRTTFKVLSQEEVARRVGKYPVAISRAQPQDPEKPVWFAKGEKNKVDAIQTKVKADYLFLVWTGDLSRITQTNYGGGTSVSYHVSVFSNVVEYPKARVAGYSIFGGSKGQSCCLFGKSEGEDINEMLKESAATMTDNFLNATRTAAAAK